jgi:hypothetical protein
VERADRDKTSGRPLRAMKERKSGIRRGIAGSEICMDEGGVLKRAKTRGTVTVVSGLSVSVRAIFPWPPCFTATAALVDAVSWVSASTSIC